MTASSVDAYLAGFDDERREVLHEVRAIIRSEIPDVTESISYQIPAYRLDGRVMVYFAGWTKHWSMYPLGERIPVELADELAPYETAKGTVRFPWAGGVPEALVRRIVRIRSEDAAAGG